MLPQHLHGVVGFSEPVANATSLLAARRHKRVSPSESSYGPGGRASFWKIRKVQKGRTPASRDVQKGHSGIRVRRFVECVPAEILLFPIARTGLREQIRVLTVVDFLRSLGKQ